MKKPNRQEIIDRLSRDNFDVLIVGGGINGAVSAASLSHQGYRVALVDQGDYASQTSQSSSNLIWGGIKYLENYEISLVNQLCVSRNKLMDAFPSQIREIRFFLPIVKSIKFGNWKRHPFFIYLGTWFYWLMGRFKTQIPKKYSAWELTQTAYSLQFNQFKGAIEYSDAYLPENDARFVYHFIRHAEKNGALVINYVKLINSEAKQIRLEDQVTKKSFSVESKWLVNAAGPFIDGINQSLKLKTKNHHVFSKGIHLIFPKIFPDEKIISFFDKEDRLFFVIPMGDRTVVGTTDNKVEHPISEVTEEDRKFLLANINRFLDDQHQLTELDIISERCGVRPLVVLGEQKNQKDEQNEEQSQSWFQLSRKHSIEINDQQLSIFGGKLTDCLNIGDEVCEKIQQLGLQPSMSSKSVNSFSSVSRYWYGEESLSSKEKYLVAADKLIKQFSNTIPELKKFIPLWWNRYGEGADEILTQLSKQGKLNEINQSSYVDLELIYILKNEQVVYFDDLLRRRTKLELVEKKSELLKHPLIKKIQKLQKENL